MMTEPIRNRSQGYLIFFRVVLMRDCKSMIILERILIISQNLVKKMPIFIISESLFWRIFKLEYI